ncbi:MAG: hypothetical protein ABI895_19540 [Deltaproteobacteria bacterium]
MNSRDMSSVRSLMSKLASLRGELSNQEQAAFSDIVQLAAKSARALSEEELRAASGGASRAVVRADARQVFQRDQAFAFPDVGVLAKGQSSHPTLVASELEQLVHGQFQFPDVGVLAKGQSSHPTLVADELSELQASFEIQR